MPESNFVSEADFEKLLNSLPIQYDNAKLTLQDWKMFFKVMYGCALRVKETTRLKPEDFDLEHKILTLNETKTGWKKTKEGKVRKAQRTTILPQDAIELKAYLASKLSNQLIWPITRQTVWHKFKAMCINSGLSYFWQKDDRAFKQGWPYLLRSSRAKIMVREHADFSLIQLKMRHKGQSVTFRYTELDIHALLAWEAEHYPLITA